ncbi:MAG: hypothetical protein QW666_02515 [Candidatus Woesearchaeota archaeon]
MNETKIYDIIFWTSLGIVAIWVFLKMIGVIHSPVWIQMVPYAGAIFAAGVFYQFVKSMKRDVYDLKSRMNIIESRTNSIERDVTEIRTDLKHIDSDLHFLKQTA